MKKLFLFAAACVALVACNKNDNALNGEAPQGTPFKAGQQVTITVNSANQGSQAPIRKINGTDKGNEFEFKWEANDKILVKVGEASAQFSIKNSTISADGKSAEFEGTMPAEGSTFDIQYPVTSNLANQTYVAGGIASGLMQFGATGCTIDSEDDINLSATSSVLQLNLYGSKTISKLVFTGNSQTCTLTCTNGVAVHTSDSVPFYVVVPAGEYTFNVAVYDNTDTKLVDLAPSAATAFTAGGCCNLPERPVNQVLTPDNFKTIMCDKNADATSLANIGFRYFFSDTYYLRPFEIVDPFLYAECFMTSQHYMAVLPKSLDVATGFMDALVNSDGNIYAQNIDKTLLWMDGEGYPYNTGSWTNWKAKIADPTYTWKNDQVVCQWGYYEGEVTGPGASVVINITDMGIYYMIMIAHGSTL